MKKDENPKEFIELLQELSKSIEDGHKDITNKLAVRIVDKMIEKGYEDLILRFPDGSRMDLHGHILTDIEYKKLISEHNIVEILVRDSIKPGVGTIEFLKIKH